MEWGEHKPKMIRVEVSDDNRTHHAMGELNFSPEEIYQEGTFRNDYSIDMGGVSARYVRVTAEGAGYVPTSMSVPVRKRESILMK